MQNTPSNRASSDVVRVSVLSPLVAALTASGTQGMAVLRRHSWPNVSDTDPYDLIPLVRYIGLFEEAAEVLDAPSLGLNLGQTAQPSVLGPMGVLAANRRTLRAMLECIVTHIGTLQGGTLSEFHEEGGLAIFDYRIVNEAIRPRRQDAEFSLAATVSLIRSLAGNSWRPVEVQFEHSPGPNVRELQLWFGVQPRFGESSNRLILRQEDLDRLQPLSPNGDKGTDITLMVERHLSDLRLNTEPADLVGQVTAVILRRMGHRDVNLSSVAADLGLSGRTLQRQLNAQDTTFGSLLTDCRRGRAQKLLQEGELNLADIASELGYADATAFARAHKAWTGHPPRRHGSNDLFP
ncbi:MAG: AraC family transcriptional regulator [Acidihalobacter sp.]|uniref:AraC-like transcriptional regulator QhpR n=1 Tax=Acidihalobacter sp. TaxID=1872108 RepID=UPI00307E1AA7